MMACNSVADEYSEYIRALKILREPNPRPVTSSIASGFGASQGALYAAASYSNLDLQTDVPGDDDGSIVLGVGLSNPKHNFGYEIALGITSVSTPWWGDGKFADEGNVNLKVHREVLPFFSGKSASLAVGASNILGWGGTNQIPTNFYTAYSEKFMFGDFNHYGALVTVGYGSSVSDGESSSDLFGGIGIARSHYGGSLSFIGPEAHISATWYIPVVTGLAVTLTRADFSNQQNAGRNILSIGYAFNLDENKP